MKKEKRPFKEWWKDNLDWFEAFVFMPIFFFFCLLAMIGVTVAMIVAAYEYLTQ